MQRILIPTDFSENSLNAIEYGLKLFKRSKCVFYLLNINPVPPYSGAGTSIKSTTSILKQGFLEESKKSLDEFLNTLEKTHSNKLHSFTTSAIYDFFIDAINNEVEKNKIDLIIMGTKGATGFKGAVIGSNTGDVITKVKCPLLAIPENALYKRAKEIAFPTDYHMSYDIKVLDTLIAMVIMNKSVLRIVHISMKGDMLNQEQETNKDFLHDYLRGIDHTFHAVRGTRLETSIQCFIDSRDIDMVAMVAKNLNFFQRILFKPSVEEISYHTEIPFLVLHE
ncbi:universal stress protein [Eudoraea sp.]|uniref:universal stress protein n=1 Tax=Eudoraea sp. TaxID=1979955 RepID=UPI003C74CAA6